MDLFMQITKDPRWRTLDVYKMKAILPEEMQDEESDMKASDTLDVNVLREACRKAQSYAQPVKALSRNSTLKKIAQQLEKETLAKQQANAAADQVYDVISEDGYNHAQEDVGDMVEGEIIEPERPQSAIVKSNRPQSAVPRKRPSTAGPQRPQSATVSESADVQQQEQRPWSASALVEAAVVGAVTTEQENKAAAKDLVRHTLLGSLIPDMSQMVGNDGGAIETNAHENENEFEGVPNVAGDVQDIANEDDFNADLENFVMPPKQVRPTSAAIAHQANMKAAQRERPATAHARPTNIEQDTDKEVLKNEVRPATAMAARPSSGSAARPRAQLPAGAKKTRAASARPGSAQIAHHENVTSIKTRYHSASRPTTADRTSRPSSSGRVSWYAISDSSRPSSGASRPLSGSSSRPLSATRTGGRTRSASRPVSGTTARDRSSSRPLSGTTQKPITSYKLSGWLYAF